ncbi:hypothetical protein KJ840_05060, partial [Patescibacteria group bacterium]|nr:hypothetical protein [Patescibacteria group bacterium]
VYFPSCPTLFISSNHRWNIYYVFINGTVKPFQVAPVKLVDYQTLFNNNAKVCHKINFLALQIYHYLTLFNCSWALFGRINVERDWHPKNETKL